MSDIDEFIEVVSKAISNPPHVSNDKDCCVEAATATNGEDEKARDAKMWAISGRDYYPAEAAVYSLKPGQYVVKESNVGLYFSERDINLDDLLVLPDSNSEKVLTHIEDFWNNEKVFREYGFLWKRGIMLWGPPGGGKTSTVQQLSKQIVDAGGITVYCVHPALTAKGLDVLRRIEPDRPLVVIFEDIDAIVKEWGETDLLAMLDGELQVDNVVFVATTNYPERLDKRFINRPSRFDEIIKVRMPNPAAREFYLLHKNPRLRNSEFEIKQWVEETEGFSVAHLKEVIISVECFNKSFDETITKLRKMMEATPGSYADDDSTGMGFLKN